MKISTSTSSSYIEVEFGSLTSLSLDNARGKIKLDIVKSKSGAYANINLDFSLEYLAALMLIIIGELATFIFYTMLEIPFIHTLSVMLVIVVIVLGIVAYSVPLTRKKILEEFNMFIQSLASKKD